MWVIWVEGSELRRNVSRGTRGEALRPACVVQTPSGAIVRCMWWDSAGSVWSVYRPRNPRQNGVVLWLETHGPVRLFDTVETDAPC